MSKDTSHDKPANKAQQGDGISRRDVLFTGTSVLAASGLTSSSLISPAEAQQKPAPGAQKKPAVPAQPKPAAQPAPAPSGKKPNILVIMGDDVGWFNIGAYHRGIMSGKTPNLDMLAAEGMMFTDYYAEASCTAGRANFITGELPLRTGLTTVGQAGADVGIPAEAVTLATDGQGEEGREAFFIWHNTTRMHVWTFLPPKYQATMNSQSNYGLEEAGMAQMDDSIGALLKHLEDIGEAENTIVIFTTDNGAEVFTWPDGGMTPFKATKGTIFEGGFRVPAIIRWPGKIKPGSVENGIFSGLDWLPTLTAAAGNPNITEQLLKGVKLGDRTYKNHLDGYNQLDLLLGKGPSARHELWYFGGPHLGALRLDDFKFVFFQQPYGWPGEKETTDMPSIINIRQDPFERTPELRGETFNNSAAGYTMDFFAREFWRFVLVQQKVAELAETAVDFPPMQAPATFNLDAIKREIQEKLKAHEGQ
jgi:arylsulfatase A-like enzyme